MKRFLSFLLVCIFALPVYGVAETSQSLAVAGFIDYDNHNKFIDANPGISVTICEDYFQDANRLIDALVTQDATFDVLIVSTQAIDFKALMQKGYAYALSSSSVINTAVHNMYSGLQEWSIYQDEVLALPLGLTSNGLTYHPEYFVNLGIDIPDSWQNIASIINEWCNQPDDVKENYTISQWTYNYRSWFLQNMMQSFDVYCQANGTEMRFDDPVFSALMEAVDGITTDNDVDENDDIAMSALDETISLFENGEDPLQNGYHSSRPIFPASIGGLKTYGAYVTLGFINPYSMHTEEAISYLEYLAQHVSPQVRLTLYPEGNTPVENEEFISAKEQWTTEEKRLQDAIAESSDESTRELQTELESHQNSWKWIERSRFAVSEDDISEYMQISNDMVYLGPSLLTMKDSNGEYTIRELQSRYLTDAISLERFIDELTKKTMMIRLENQ